MLLLLFLRMSNEYFAGKSLSEQLRIAFEFCFDGERAGEAERKARATRTPSSHAARQAKAAAFRKGLE